MHCLVLAIDPSVIKQYMDNSISDRQEQKVMTRRAFTTVMTTDFDYELDYIGVLPPRDTNQTTYLPEMLVFNEMSRHEDYQDLLCHPFILVFVAMKWYTLRYFFYFDFSLHFIYTVMLNMFLQYRIKSLELGLAIVFGILVIWELSRLLCFGKLFIRDFDNWFNISALILSLSSLLMANFTFFSARDHEIYAKQLYAVTAFVSVLNIFIIFGSLPIISTSVMMIKSVYKTLIKAFVTYMVLITAFSVALFILFSEPKSQNFGNFFLTVFSSILMMTGDLEVVTVELSKKKPFAYIVVVLFILMIIIGLMNLLVGLAVNDIQEIKAKSSLFTQMSRIRSIIRIEKLVLRKHTLKYLPCVKNLCLFPTNIQKPTVLLNVDKRTVTCSGRKTFKLYRYVIEVWQRREKTEDE